MARNLLEGLDYWALPPDVTPDESTAEAMCPATIDLRPDEPMLFCTLETHRGAHMAGDGTKIVAIWTDDNESEG